ncbi:phospho-sugar mutase [Petroclostridium sp. X23]|uniref:phospho-sugar mutase n=1 Tax=Petroclostridium sp. X23 TaxID=3045146 RepID=UPI0024AD31BE|nr:phospho-sugar mutase [Petroclostridium sp. X23]WHH57407.1 phospho-sugar mutase [Petroclostridium sp. X23]
MNYMEQYKYWLESPYVDQEIKEELKQIENDEKEIEERFYTNLAFGTGGLRGIIGAGTNRMNKYTVRKATQGLATYISKLGQDAKNRGVVIAYDSRYRSPEFAMESAKVLAANGVKAYVFDELRPTPELSFAVRELGAMAGIVITASHNPAKYNGYKAYGEDGGQLPPESADVVLEVMDSIDIFTGVNVMDEHQAKASGLIQMIGEEIDVKYLAKVKEQSINPEIVEKMAEDFKVIYTPFHGTGNKPVRRILDMIGMKNVLIVKEQEQPDPAFSTVKSPNPEEKDGFTIAIEMAKKENVDLIIGTDPDCDRIGVVVRNKEGEYVTLSGNQMGVLLTEYVLSQKKEKGTLPSNGVVIKTIVTTEMARAVAEHYDVEIMDVLTGFKFIGERIKEFEQNGNKKQYVFGFEESYGYLAGTYARDKDAVVAAMLIVEMAAWYKSRGMSLFEGMQELYDRYGVYLESLKSITLEGKEGIEKMKDIMDRLRKETPEEINGVKVTVLRDYKASKRYDMIHNKEEVIHLPKSDVLYFELEDKSWFVVRPSGTEPKIKIYFSVVSDMLPAAQKKLTSFMEEVVANINK